MYVYVHDEKHHLVASGLDRSQQWQIGNWSKLIKVPKNPKLPHLNFCSIWCDDKLCTSEKETSFSNGIFHLTKNYSNLNDLNNNL